MLKIRIDYWNCSKFADWLRGSKKPGALTHEEWEKWRETTKKNNPYRYWLAEKGLRYLQDIIYYPCDIYRTIKIYIQNRYFDKVHYLKTGLKPGQFYDLDTRILHGLFYELIDFVEIECSHIMKCYKDRNYKFNKGRCEQAGIDYLNWACGLTYKSDYGFDDGADGADDPTPQAKSAKKTLELYNWWKNRDNRPDPYEIHKEENDKNWYKKIHKMEMDYEKEDTKMLIELIKIRGSLWT